MLAHDTPIQSRRMAVSSLIGCCWWIGGLKGARYDIRERTEVENESGNIASESMCQVGWVVCKLHSSALSKCAANDQIGRLQYCLMHPHALHLLVVNLLDPLRRNRRHK
jgi:hypothetical protein